MKILIVTLTNPNAPHVWKQTAQSVFAAQMAYTGGACDWFVRAHDNTHPEPYVNITHNYNVARQAALDGGYDAMLSIECDMIVPPDTIQRLIDCESDIAYGLYVFRHGFYRWSAYTELGLFGGWSISRNPAEAKAAWGKVIDVAGVGLGCTLIRRHVLEQVPFRLYDGNDDDWIISEYAEQAARVGLDLSQPKHKMFANDWLFAMDAQHYGFTQRCDLGLVCGHLSYKPFPLALWPDPDAERLYQRKPLSGVTFEPAERIEVACGMGETLVPVLEPEAA